MKQSIFTIDTAEQALQHCKACQQRATAHNIKLQCTSVSCALGVYKCPVCGEPEWTGCILPVDGVYVCRECFISAWETKRGEKFERQISNMIPRPSAEVIRRNKIWTRMLERK